MVLIYADTSFWVSYLMPDELKHAEAEQYARGAQDGGNPFFITNLVLQEAITAIRRKYALKANEKPEDRTSTANRLGERNPSHRLEHDSYMKRVNDQSQEKVGLLVDRITNDTDHFKFETPDQGTSPLTAFEIFRRSLAIIKEQTRGETLPVFPGHGRDCRICKAIVSVPFLTYRAVGAQDVLHLLLALHRQCGEFVTLDKGYNELKMWSLGKIQIAVL